jgi:hypothetical protein
VRLLLGVGDGFTRVNMADPQRTDRSDTCHFHPILSSFAVALFDSLLRGGKEKGTW